MTTTGGAVGRSAVMDALVQATIELIVDEGLAISVRQIAARAGVNHGLVHTYFGNKDGLLVAAFEEINRRAALELDDDGFPPLDLATRRDAELARAIARMRLEGGSDLVGSHPVSSAWVDALRRTRPDLGDEEIQHMVVTATALALGWALFADHLVEVHGIDDQARTALEDHVGRVVARLGGLPGATDD